MKIKWSLSLLTLFHYSGGDKFKKAQNLKTLKFSTYIKTLRWCDKYSQNVDK